MQRYESPKIIVMNDKILRLVILIICLCITNNAQADLLILQNNQLDKFLFKSSNSQNPSTKNTNIKINPDKATVIKPKQRSIISKQKPLSRVQLIQNEINAEIRNMNKDIIQYNKAKDMGNIKLASKILESILDRKNTIKILKKEQLH
jgi:hypothetical protein